MRNRIGMKSGFTMSELIIVLVIMGGLSYIVFNKLFGAKTKQEIESTVKADLEAITAAADKFRMNSRDGKYVGLTMSKISGYLPSNMKQMGPNGVIGSTAGTHEWAGSLSFGEMCRYTVASNAGNGDRTFNIAMNCSKAILNLGWNQAEASLTEQVFHEFIIQKYGYSAGKGLVNPAAIAEPANFAAVAENTAVYAIGAINLGADVAPTSANFDGQSVATDLRGF